MALGSTCTKGNEKGHHVEPSNPNAQEVPVKVPSQQVPSCTSSWAVDDLLELTDFESPDKVRQLCFSILVAYIS